MNQSQQFLLINFVTQLIGTALIGANADQVLLLPDGSIRHPADPKAARADKTEIKKRNSSHLWAASQQTPREKLYKYKSTLKQICKQRATNMRINFWYCCPLQDIISHRVDV